jgi:hypothetical protein
MKLYFNSEDASQIGIGAFAMSMPIAFRQFTSAKCTLDTFSHALHLFQPVPE